MKIKLCDNNLYADLTKNYLFILDVSFISCITFSKGHKDYGYKEYPSTYWIYIKGVTEPFRAREEDCKELVNILLEKELIK